MNKKPNPQISNQFKTDVLKKLTATPKTLNSRYLYDKKGDELFQEIMHLPEYYLTHLEYEILEENKEDIAESFSAQNGFDLIELVAGDSKKTKILLRYPEKEKMSFKYVSVDISDNALEKLTSSLKEELPTLEVAPQQGTYAEVLERLGEYKSREKVIMFLGSNLGNLLPEQAVNFLKEINHAMGPEDLFFIGLDLKKHPQKILDAYNGSSGVTAEFNKNLLTRINREMGGDFDEDSFLHWPVYNPETGTTKSYLVSTRKQPVQIKSLNLEVMFEAWESIHTEISQKYDSRSVNWLTQESGMKIIGSFTGEKQYFKNYIFRKKQSYESNLERKNYSRE